MAIPPRGALSSITLLPAPLYVLVSGEPPRLEVLSESMVQWRALPPFSSWTCAAGARCTQTGSGRQIQTQALKYANQLFSPPFPVRSGVCQVARFQIAMQNGSAVVAVLDGNTSRLLDDRKVYVQGVPAKEPQTMELRFNSNSSNSAKLVIANGNSSDIASEFSVVGGPQIADCK